MYFKLKYFDVRINKENVISNRSNWVQEVTSSYKGWDNNNNAITRNQNKIIQIKSS